MKKYRIIFNETKHSRSVVYTDEIIEVLQLQFEHEIRVQKLAGKDYTDYYKSFLFPRIKNDYDVKTPACHY